MNEEPIHSLLTGFETAQLANLCCEEAEEAKALIPRYMGGGLYCFRTFTRRNLCLTISVPFLVYINSLANKIDDDTLQNFLNQTLDLKKFQT